MTKTKIDWADHTWNPITGCYHGCNYCYAEKIANRFGTGLTDLTGTKIHVLDKPAYQDGKHQLYPYGFMPTFHTYRLDEPAKERKNSAIFAGSMSDMFGEWVPNSWIYEIFEACDRAPQHMFMFLTKNPARYIELLQKNMLPKKHWYGTTVETPNKAFAHIENHNMFLSIEPMQADFGHKSALKSADIKWVIVGAESGKRPDKVQVQHEWIENMRLNCEDANIPIFMKNSLEHVYKGELIQQFPRVEDEQFRQMEI